MLLRGTPAKDFQMKVFEEEWVERLRQQYHVASRYTVPFIARFALDPLRQEERDKLEAWFQRLPEDERPDMLARLRSADSRQHFGAYYELVAYEFLKAMGYSVDIHPKLDEGKPDLVVTGKGLSKPVIIDVATVFDEPSWEKEEQKLNQIVEKLDKIEHYFAIIVAVRSEYIPERLDYDRLSRYVRARLDSCHSQARLTSHEFEYHDGELHLGFTAIPSEEKGPIVYSHGLPARFIGTGQIASAIEKKIQRYRSAKERGLPFVVAIHLTDVPAEERGLLTALFGTQRVTINTDRQSGEPIGVKQGTGFDGLLTPKPGLGGRARNTRLSAVLNIQTKRLPRNEQEEQARRVHFFRVIENPWASNPLEPVFLPGHPRYLKIKESQQWTTLGWVNEGNGKPFDC